MSWRANVGLADQDIEMINLGGRATTVCYKIETVGSVFVRTRRGIEIREYANQRLPDCSPLALSLGKEGQLDAGGSAPRFLCSRSSGAQEHQRGQRSGDPTTIAEQLRARFRDRGWIARWRREAPASPLSYPHSSSAAFSLKRIRSAKTLMPTSTLTAGSHQDSGLGRAQEIALQAERGDE